MRSLFASLVTLALCVVASAQDVKVTNKATTRKQAAFKEWARAIRENQESKNRGAERMLREKESKIRIKYGINANQLTQALKQGLIEKWPTEFPKDRVCAQTVLDPLILQDEINEWELEHAVGRIKAMQTIPGDSNSYRPVTVLTKGPDAPLTSCKTKKPDGQPCNRKTVGKPGRACYEHRG